MALFLVNGVRTPLIFNSGFIPGQHQLIFPGSAFLSYINQDLQLIMHELIAELYSIRHNSFQFFKNQAIESVFNKAGLHTRIMMENDLHFQINDFGSVHLRKDQLTSLWSETAHCTAFYEANRTYKTLDFYFNPLLVDQLLQFFPELQSIIIQDDNKILFSQPLFITPSLRHVIKEILECPYDVATSQFYFELKMREFLLVMLDQKRNEQSKRYKFTPYEIEQLHEGRKILLTQIEGPPISIRELARKVAINEFKLKAGFKQLFGMGVFESLQHARMDKARELVLQTNKPIKEICLLAGYPRMTNFITAFRKRFGYTPGSLRRK